ncbi:hypothetical protein CASFOL_033721 [Castilleja foliolosa]|uniref:Uncharacterized protein n=1 Tax=Castilleja foliolosa TaxID=1961234 RepID=A0ABD3BXR5_9LAMI
MGGLKSQSGSAPFYNHMGHSTLEFDPTGLVPGPKNSISLL